MSHEHEQRQYYPPRKLWSHPSLVGSDQIITVARSEQPLGRLAKVTIFDLGTSRRIIYDQRLRCIIQNHNRGTTTIWFEDSCQNSVSATYRTSKIMMVTTLHNRPTV